MNTLRRLVLVAAALAASSAALAAAPATIHQAAQAGDLLAVASFLADGVDVNLPDAEGRTALEWATVNGHADVVDLLLGAGADVSLCDVNGRTALHYAAAANEKFTLNALLAAGADVHAVDVRGDTPLHAAARRFRPLAVSLLLEAGADANAQNADGQTPLHVLGADERDGDEAFATLVDSIAQVLIGSGADPLLRDHNGQRAWPHPAAVPGEGRPPSGYPSYDDIANTLLTRQNQYPAICKRFDLGESSTTKRMYALKISDNIDGEEDEPEFRYISSLHGDEVVGVVMCLNLIDYLLQNYGVDPRVTNIVNSIELWIMPCANPYGYANNTRYNAYGADLNRSFPEGSGTPEPNTIDGREKEVQTIMLWGFAHPFVQSANFHGGALVANYPFDNDGHGSTFSPTPDEDMFVYISEKYSYYNSPMWNSTEFTHGITNGAAWYAIDGGLQDWSYRYMGCNDVTIELGNTKSPAYSQMPTYWSQNRESMLSYLEQCLIGVRGLVTDAQSGLPLSATVSVVGRSHNVYTDPQVGDYHRMLLPGAYQLKFEVPGYDAVIYPATVATGPATRLDVPMGPSARVTFPNGGEALAASTPTTVTWIGNPTARFQVQFTANYGQNAVVTDDFERAALGSDYTTGGNANWAISSTSAHSPTRSAKAGTISHTQSTWLTRTINGTQVGFWYRVSSEPNYDFFNFYVDSVQKVHASGTTGTWTQFSVALTPGSHVLKWEYTKDGNVSGGSDTAWLDDLTVTADQTTWTDIIALTDPGATSVAWTTPATLGDDYKVRARANYGGSTYGDWDESDATFTIVAAPYLLGDANCNGVVDFDDINPFVLALGNPVAYQAAYPNCPLSNSDCNLDGIVDFDDITAFVALLSPGF